MELVTTAVKVAHDFVKNIFEVTFTVDKEYNDIVKKLANMPQQKQRVSVKKYSEKRTLDANAYAWVLMNKIAIVLEKTKDEVYLDFIQKVGAFETIAIKDESVETYIKIWEHNGLGWVCKTFPSKIKGCTNIHCYYGSSVYDVSEMYRLTNEIKYVCDELDIPTEPPEETERRLSLWQGR